ncbi:MAG: HAMP domain-containing protein [candidate division KSB1 bacterium]|nr:HAMP domain-containing protein [candidate division KSB1 bacterium]
MLVFLVWTLAVFLGVGGYLLWPRRRVGRRESFRLRLTFLLLAFGLLPCVATVFWFTRGMDQLVRALSVPGLDLAVREAIEVLQQEERRTEQRIQDQLRRDGPEACLQDSSVLWVALLADSSGTRFTRIWGDTGRAGKAPILTGDEAGRPKEILHRFRVQSTDGRWYLVCRRYPPALSRTLQDLGQCLRAYGTLTLVREGVMREQVLWALSASAVVVLGVVAGIVARATARGIAKPISHLASAMERATHGDLDIQAPEEGDDEIANLARTFNRMIVQLREGRERLARAERLAAWREATRRLSLEVSNLLRPALEELRQLRGGSARDRATSEALLRSLQERLSRLSQLTTMFSELGSLPEPSFENVPLNPFVREVVSLLEAEKQGIRFTFVPDESLASVRTDRLRFRRALMCLLRDQIGRISPRGSVCVSTRASAKPGLAAEVVIGVEERDSATVAAAEEGSPVETPDVSLEFFVAAQILEELGGAVELRRGPGTYLTVISLPE